MRCGRYDLPSAQWTRQFQPKLAVSRNVFVRVPKAAPPLKEELMPLSEKRRQRRRNTVSLTVQESFLVVLDQTCTS